jgi:hypothetical protein
VFAALLTTLAASACGSDVHGCRPGIREVEGTPARVFCGPARATVRVQSGEQAPRTLHFRNGECRRHARYFTLHIGAIAVSPTAKVLLPYFGLVVGDVPSPSIQGGEHVTEGLGPVVSKDGTYRGGLIAVYWRPHTGYSFSGREQLQVTLTDDRRAGSLVGAKPANAVLKTPSQRITASFTC